MIWGPEDFVVTGVILGAVAGAFWLAFRQSTRIAYLIAFAAALGALFLLVWASLAVGIVGAPSHPANLLFAAVLAVAVIGMVLSRLQPGGLSRAMWATAAAQLAAGTAAVILTAQMPGAPGIVVVTLFNLGLAAAFGLSAWLFRVEDGLQRAGRAQGFDAGPRPY